MVGGLSDPEIFLGAVGRYYSSNEVKLVSMPFNSSTPVLYYNKDAFKAAGLDTDNPPKTWQELAEAAKKIRAAGYECGYTTSWPSWILLENFSALHNFHYSTYNNGFGSFVSSMLVDVDFFY